MLDERLSIAPMVDWTDCHYRMVMRGITRKTVLYTEMIVDDAAINCTSLDFVVGKHKFMDPSVVQLGGHDPESLARAAQVCDEYGGYSEINLNCGCPSPRVAQRCFGAKLMLQPELVRRIVSEMQRRVSVPVTVKCRLGVDEVDSYEDLLKFIRCAAEGGARKILMHSRKCLLNGLTTKQNRDIPPLKYEVTHRLVQEFPELTFVLNGGIKSLSDAHQHLNTAGYTFRPTREQLRVSVLDLQGSVPRTADGSASVAAVATAATDVPLAHAASSGCVPGSEKLSMTQRLAGGPHLPLASLMPAEIQAALLNGTETEAGAEMVFPAVHGIMIGRAAYSNPVMFATADSEFYGVRDPGLSRRQIIEQFLEYCEWVQSSEGPRRWSTDGKSLQMASTAVLLNAIRNVICGIRNVAKFRRALNEGYERRVKGIRGAHNPPVRDVVEEALQACVDEDLDAPLGNTTAFQDITRATAAPIPADSTAKMATTRMQDDNDGKDLCSTDRSVRQRTDNGPADGPPVAPGTGSTTTTTTTPVSEFTIDIPSVDQSGRNS